MRKDTNARRHAAATLVAVGLLATGATGAAGAQAQGTVDARWQGWLGCWQTADAPRTMADDDAPVTCVIPAAGESAVELVTVVAGKVVSRDRIVANGQRRETTRDNCTGWEEARWAADGRRVFLTSAYTCPGAGDRASSGMISMSATGEWLDVQGVTAGGATGVHVVRYDAVGVPAALPAEVAEAVRQSDPGRSSSLIARTVAASPIDTRDVAEAVRLVDASVVQAWITERQQGFELDARELVALADAGVPGRVIDVMVALSYPTRFAVAPTGRGDVQPVAAPRAPSVARGDDLRRPSIGLGVYDTFDAFDAWPYGYSRFGYGYGISRYGYSPYGFSRFGYSPYGYGGFGGGYGYYPGSGPVVVIRDPNGGTVSSPQPSNGRVVNGRGYTRGNSEGGSSTGRSATPRSTGTRPANESLRDRGTTTSTTSRPAEPRRAAGSSSGGTSTGRTAKPRNP